MFRIAHIWRGVLRKSLSALVAAAILAVSLPVVSGGAQASVKFQAFESGICKIIRAVAAADGHTDLVQLRPTLVSRDNGDDSQEWLRPNHCLGHFIVAVTSLVQLDLHAATGGVGFHVVQDSLPSGIAHAARPKPPKPVA